MAQTINLGRVGIVPKGTWNGAVQYLALDLVDHDDCAWLAKRQNLNVEPSPANNLDWQLISNNDNLVETVLGYKEDAEAAAEAAGQSASDAAASAEYGEDAYDAIAPDYADLVFPVTSGTYCWHSGALYVAKVDIATSEAWTAAHWDAVTVGGEIAEVKSAIGEITVPKLTKISGAPITGKYIDAAGAVVDASSGASNWEVTDYIDVSEWAKVAITASAYTNRMYYAFYDSSKQYIANSGKAYISDTVLRDEIVSVPAGAKYCVAMWYYTTVGNDPIIKGVTTIINGDAVPDDFVKKVIGKNLLNIDDMTAGYINNSSGAMSASDSYKTSDYIPIKNGQKVVFSTRIRKFLAYDSNKASISASYLTNETAAGYVYTASADGFVRASFYNTDLNNAMVEYGETSTAYVPYRHQIQEDVYFSDTLSGEISNISGNPLSGKKWVACGDSFTAGDFADAVGTVTFQSGKYKGRNMVYPYWIGNRNVEMDVINEAVSGSTMGGGTYGVNPFSGTRYQNIPSDADYITLMFGINDGSKGVPIGTIDDNDNTTFYGAWNVVLDYLTTNFPFAHIGIIVGPGMQSATAYAEAEIAIAKKWGIPYLNVQFESGEKMPLMLRTSNPNVSSAIKSRRDSQQYVNASTNHHPNVEAHELESAFIEAFLKRI